MTSPNSPEEPEDKEIVPVYLLCQTSEQESAALIKALTSGPDDEDLAFVRPHLVPWTGGAQDGDVDDMYRLVKQLRREDGDTPDYHAYFFFVDRTCLETNQVIVAGSDSYTLLYSEATLAEMDALRDARCRGADTMLPDWGEVMSEALETDMLARALAYGRMSASGFRGTWANLWIAHMDMDDLVEVYGGEEMQVLRDEEWDVDEFWRKVERVYAERAEEEDRRREEEKGKKEKENEGRREGDGSYGE